MTENQEPRSKLPTTTPETRSCWEQDWVDAFLRCPRCRARDLTRTAASVRCRACAHHTTIGEDGVLANLVDAPPATTPTDSCSVAARVRAFYEQHPFPNYDGFESVGDLLARASRSIYAAMLDRQIPIGARVLEVGCGTGQLGLFLSVGGRAVVGVDMSRASLRLASDFAQRHGLRDCQFVHGSLFDLPIADGVFDLVICKGVLHHTADPAGGLRAVLRALRPGGYVVCGLYNRIGRIPTLLRRTWFRATGLGRSADLVLREMAESEHKARSWYLDQYAHPHESRHSVDEVLGWFERNGVSFVRCVPSLQFGNGMGSERLFASEPRGTRLSRVLAQASWMFSIGREGALFDMIGRKPPEAT
jgi:SAM-dependent methyltransferase